VNDLTVRGTVFWPGSSWAGSFVSGLLPASSSCTTADKLPDGALLPPEKATQQSGERDKMTTVLPEQRLFPGMPGMVSYTYRNDFAKDLGTTLDEIKQLGITDMEFSSTFGHSAERIRQELDDRGIQCSSYGVGYVDLQNSLKKVIADASTLGASFVRVAWVPHQGSFGLVQAEEAALTFKSAGQVLRDHGLTFCYHNHGYEFAPHDGGTLFDLIVRRTSPGAVSFELDVLWAHLPGQDPAQLLDRYPERFRLMHLKDLRRGVVGDLTGHTAPENDVALGDGRLDLPGILRSARHARIEHYYLEDESPDFARQVPRSLSYLASLRSRRDGAP
jgi:sugar phosphate isomerase/epimerase